MSVISPSASIGASNLRQKIWDGVIPVEITLAPDDCSDLNSVDVLYLNVHRLSYFPIYFSKFALYFKPFLRDFGAVSSSEWWLEFEGVPLKWNWPIGLLYDLLTGLNPNPWDEDTSSGFGQGSEKDNDDQNKEELNWHLPWSLILHYSHYPTDVLLRLTDLQDVKDHWVNRLKEVDYLRRGNSNTVMNLSKADSDAIWYGVEQHDFDKFWSINSKILPSDPMSLRNVPIKVYLPSCNKVLQALVPPLAARNEVHTLGTALNLHLPELFPSRRTCIFSRPVLHGVNLSLAVPLVELLYECMYTDGYLHICIAMIR
ncbi:autophagy protein Apg5-domain-containing protein [Lipomyces arxii]|uniref:autophagy protein Apg5-domain-containing protein n=1 Tax=Lipomyces arxii TaxID=56418 RepID=UPI0034CF1831